MTTFELKTYAPQMVHMAETYKLDAQAAVERFVTNLTTMSDFYPGAEDLNFRVLGQQWNKLGYKVRNSQKAEVVEVVSKKLLPAPTTKSRSKQEVL